MTQVSVIIPTYNRKKKVVRAISSVLSQNYRDFDVIVVDDGSTDGTKDELERFKDNIRIIKHPENMGVSRSRNSGIMASRSPLVTFLDSDDYWLPRKLDVQVRYFRHNPGVVACQTDEIWIRNGVRVNPRKKHLKPSGDIFVPSLKLCLVSPSAVMLKRSLLDEAGLFDESYPVCEDYDLWLRIGYRYPIYLINERLVVKEGGMPDQLSASRKGMDRYRIGSMIKLLKSGGLNKDQRQEVLRELRVKCRIYGEGCIKRGRKEEGEYYLSIISMENPFS